VCLSPVLLQFTDDPIATRNIAGLGFLIILAEVFTFSALRELEEWINLFLGLCLVALPFLMDVTSVMAKANAVVSGSLVVLLSAYEIWDSNRPVGPDLST